MKNPSFSTVLRWTDRQCQAYLEQVRWPNGPVCPWCGTTQPYRVVRKPGTRNRVGSLYKCRSCRRQFSATVGTIFERSKVPLRKWFAAIYPMCAFKRGIGAQQIQVQTKVTYKTAWLMCQRVREAMAGSGHIVTETRREGVEARETGGDVVSVGVADGSP